MAAKQTQLQATVRLDVTQLVDVIDVLKKCNFPNSRWLSLGLRLGLLKTTLDAIRSNNGTVEDCLMECLSKWLSKADSRGSSPTWDSLSAALRAIDENAVADQLDHTEKWPVAIAILSVHDPSLSQSLSDPVSVARLLYGEHVITGAVLANVESTGQSLFKRKMMLLAAVREAVQNNYWSLQTFGAVLCKFTGNVRLGKAILSDYAKAFPDSRKDELALSLNVKDAIEEEIQQQTLSADTATDSSLETINMKKSSEFEIVTEREENETLSMQLSDKEKENQKLLEQMRASTQPIKQETELLQSEEQRGTAVVKTNDRAEKVRLLKERIQLLTEQLALVITEKEDPRIEEEIQQQTLSADTVTVEDSLHKTMMKKMSSEIEILRSTQKDGTAELAKSRKENETLQQKITALSMQLLDKEKEKQQLIEQMRETNKPASPQPIEQETELPQPKEQSVLIAEMRLLQEEIQLLREQLAVFSTEKKDGSNYQTAVSTKPMEKRNILLVGKRGVGVSTVANQLLDKECFPVCDAPSAVPGEAKIGVSEFEYDGTRYKFTVIDTNGLFHIHGMSNTAIMKNAKKAIKKHVDGLHLVIFVVREGRFTTEEKETFEIVHNHFIKDIDPISMMVITGREGRSKEDVVREYRSNPVTREFVNHMKKGVYEVGFPDLTECSESVKSFIKQRADDDAAMLRKKITECDTKFLNEELYGGDMYYFIRTLIS